jgi:hypothetical protein
MGQGERWEDDAIRYRENKEAALLARILQVGATGPQGPPGNPGVDALTSYLTNEASVITCDAEGNPPAGQLTSTVMVVRRGSATDTLNWVVSASPPSDPAYVEWQLIGATLFVNGFSNQIDTAEITLTATRAGYPVLTRKFSLAKSKTGAAGSDGAQGTPGTPGADGQTPYLHIAYATNATGTAGFSTTDAIGKTYIGTYTDFTPADSSDPALYTWALFQGPQGTPGTPGTPGTSGPRGSMIFYVDMGTGTAWTDTAANTATAAYGGSRIGDTVTEYSNTITPKWAVTKFWTGSAWVAPGLVIDGSLLVHGTVVTEALASDAIRTGNYAFTGTEGGADEVATAGAKMQNAPGGTALLVAPENFKIGSTLIKDTWFGRVRMAAIQGFRRSGGQWLWDLGEPALAADWTITYDTGVNWLTFTLEGWAAQGLTRLQLVGAARTTAGSTIDGTLNVEQYLTGVAANGLDLFCRVRLRQHTLSSVTPANPELGIPFACTWSNDVVDWTTAANGEIFNLTFMAFTDTGWHW